MEEVLVVNRIWSLALCIGVHEDPENRAGWIPVGRVYGAFQYGYHPTFYMDFYWFWENKTFVDERNEYPKVSLIRTDFPSRFEK